MSRRVNPAPVQAVGTDQPDGLVQPEVTAGPELSTQRLRDAIEGRAIIPLFQPIIDLATGETTGCEVLARWTDGELGAISPDVFIPAAERAGLLDKMMISLLQPVADAMHRTHPRLSFSINVSPSQLRDSWFSARFLSYIRRLNIPPQRLIVEITEAVLIRDFASINATLKSLRAQGIRIALDDFGTGYSNLQYLCAIDCDIVKIDRCFVERLGREGASRKVIQAVVGLGSGLGFSITAEGIETDEQARLLLQLGCDRGQGFMYSRPVSGREFVRSNGLPSRGHPVRELHGIRLAAVQPVPARQPLMA